MTAQSDRYPGYDAARAGAAFIDRSDRVRVEFTGAKAADTLNGLLTNDVLSLTPGTGQYAAALTAKGKVIADVRVFARDGAFLVDTPAAAGPGLLTMLRKYVNPRLAKYRDVSAELATIGVFGPGAARAVASATGVGLPAVESLALFGTAAAAAIIVARVPDLGVPGFDILAPPDAVDGLVAALRGAGATSLGAATAEVLRVEAGRPMYGPDMDETVLAQEAALDRLDAISFDKGCYTGQETVARVHFRGHVNRTLRGVRSGAEIASGAELVNAEGAVVGTVRSIAQSPAYGPIALAYVRREVEDGASVAIAPGSGSATVTALPFA